MKLFRPHGGLRIAGLSLILLLVVLVGAACAPALPLPGRDVAQPTATQPTAGEATVGAPTAVQAPVGPPAPGSGGGSSGKASAAPVGVDADGNFYRGDPQAPVKIVEFSDFQCPFCARHDLQTGPLLDEAYIATGKVVLYYRHFPLSQIHPNAIPASKAAYCAGQQAPRLFWDMHGWLFANQTTWSNASDAAGQFRAAALAFGVEGARYDACLNDPQTEARINRDLQEGMALGVEGTPAFFINDWFLAGAYPFAEFQTVIAKADQGLHPPPTPTPLPPNVAPYDADPTRPGFTYDGSPSLGAAKAPVLLFVFSDFGCTGCIEFARNVQPTLREKYIATGQVRLIYKFLAVSAPQTALAAYCAGSQGKFWEFSDQLATDQGKWQEGDRAAMVGYAATLGLNATAFEKCLTDATGQAQLDADRALADQVQITQIPYFLALNPVAQTGLRIPNLVPLDQFEKVLQDLQKPPSATPASGAQPTPAPVAAAPRLDLPVGVDADGNFYRGDPQAPVKIVEFSDFQCPFCARHNLQTGPLLDEAYIATGKVVWVFRNFPLNIHPNAVPAAKAAYCAGRQAPKWFWAMHDWLFANQNSWANTGAANAAAQFRQQALALGADGGKYDACVKDAGTEARIQQDFQAGNKLGVRGTPAFFLNRVDAQGKTTATKTVSGALPFEQFDQTIKALLDQ